jgi:class 3 adenylate cyclase
VARRQHPHQPGASEALEEAYAHRDRALLYQVEGKLEEAEEHSRQSEALFAAAGYEEGLMRLRWVQGVLARGRRQFDESEKQLRKALAYFDRTHQQPRAARMQLEIARTLAEAGALPQLVRGAFLDALRRAEACRRTYLVRVAEEELLALDEQAHWEHIFHRVRGRVATDTSSLVDGETEVATALFVNLVGFVPFCQGFDAGEVMQTVNQMMADLVDALEKHRGHVTAYLGGGFMALLRGHGERAVAAGLDLVAVVEEFNRPRAVLGLRQLPVRIGIATGNMFLGNIGTYRRMDFTAVGAAVNLAGRLMRHADPKAPCISQETYEQVRDRFTFAPGGPRSLELADIGRREVWDVTGRREGTVDG